MQVLLEIFPYLDIIARCISAQPQLTRQLAPGQEDLLAKFWERVEYASGPYDKMVGAP